MISVAELSYGKRLLRFTNVVILRENRLSVPSVLKHSERKKI